MSNLKLLQKSMTKFYPLTNRYQDFVRQDVLCEARLRFLVKYPDFQSESLTQGEVDRRMYGCIMSINSTDYLRKSTDGRMPYAYGYGKFRKEIPTAPLLIAECGSSTTTHALMDLTFSQKKALVKHGKSFSGRTKSQYLKQLKNQIVQN